MTAPTRAPLDEIHKLTAFVARLRQQLPAKPVRATATPAGGTLVGRHEYTSANHEHGQATTAIGRQPVPADPWDHGLAETGTRILTVWAINQARSRRAVEEPLLFQQLIEEYGYPVAPEHGEEGGN